MWPITSYKPGDILVASPEKLLKVARVLGVENNCKYDCYVLPSPEGKNSNQQFLYHDNHGTNDYHPGSPFVILDHVYLDKTKFPLTDRNGASTLFMVLHGLAILLSVLLGAACWLLENFCGWQIYSFFIPITVLMFYTSFARFFWAHRKKNTIKCFKVLAPDGEIVYIEPLVIHMFLFTKV